MTYRPSVRLILGFATLGPLLFVALGALVGFALGRAYGDINHWDDFAWAERGAWAGASVSLLGVVVLSVWHALGGRPDGAAERKD